VRSSKIISWVENLTNMSLDVIPITFNLSTEVAPIELAEGKLTTLSSALLPQLITR
jgi:hypothetical protein